MIQKACDREPLIVAAVRSGDWPDGLRDHIAECPTCAETKQIAQLFRQSAIASAALQPPSAHIVWEKLQARRRQQAIRRATQSITLLCVFAALYAVAFVAWYLPGLWNRQVATDISPLLSGPAFAGVLAAVLAVLIGSCCFAYLGSRTSFRLR